MASRYEILPFGDVLTEVESAPRPLIVTVTCSPRYGLDRTVEWAERVAALGHRAVVHLAARALRDPDHLDAVLERMAAHGLTELFVIGGDNAEPAGPYASAVDLMPLLAVHPHRPATLGIGAYAEGHPLIDAATLSDALRHKAEYADYMVTQLCFDSEALLRWLRATRAAGIDLPLRVGLPGAVDRRRLMEISMRVGVGTSISFLRKQRGLLHLLGRRAQAADRLYRHFAPLVGDAELGVAGLHFFTFNRLEATLAWEADRARHGLSRNLTQTGARSS